MGKTIQTGVLVIGGGAAGLAAAYTLATHGRRGVTVIDKGRAIGSHSLSGAIVRPASLRRLLGGDFPTFATPVASDKVVWLTNRRHLACPAPPPIRSRGCLLMPYGRLCRHLAGLCERAGVEVHTELAAEEPVIENGRVVGVELLGGERVLADCVVLAEGSRGLVTGKVIQALRLQPDTRFDSYALGMKILVDVGSETFDGVVYHTMGYPLGMGHFGGGFVYGMGGRVHIGLVIGLEYGDPSFDVHEAFERFRRHPFVERFIRCGRVIRFGAKVVNEGGYHAMPRLVGDGVAIVGEAAGLVNAMTLKGIDLAIASGVELGKVLAAGRPLDDYPRALRRTAEFRAFRRARNVHAYFTRSVPAGMLATGLAMVTRGWLPPRIRPRQPRVLPCALARRPAAARTADRATLVHLARVHNRGPVHVSVDPDRCRRCLAESGQPCVHFCPAGVYESDIETGEILVRAADCIHCRTCSVKDPYESIHWTAPVDGPRYAVM